ncbi:MAG: PRC-barrel domain-containing protein [Archaeoglobaceae archaeon]
MLGEITNFFGMRVYTDEGRYVGKVEDVIIDSESRSIRGLAVVDVNRAVIDTKARGIIIPYRIVKAVGDIIIIKDVFKRRKVEVSEEEAVEVEA